MKENDMDNYKRLLTVLIENRSKTALGEPQYWAFLTDGCSIEVTLESAGMEENDWYYSVRLHCSNDDFDTEKYRETNGVVDVKCSSDNSFSEAVKIAFDMLTAHNGTLCEQLFF